MNKKELMNLNEINSLGGEMSATGIKYVTELVAIAPNALAAPVQQYHEAEIRMKLMKVAMEHQTFERTTICDTIVKLAQLGELDSERFQMFMVIYGMKRF